MNFNYFVKFLNDNYGLFPYKSLNWDSLCTSHSRLITSRTSPDSLFIIISNLAGKLRDKHLWIDNDKYAFNFSLGKVVLTSQLDSIFASRRKYKNIDLIKSKYLNNKVYSSEINNSVAGLSGDDTGYLSIGWFDRNIHRVDSVTTEIVRFLSNCRYLIIDIRNNTGGTDSSALTVANHFVKTGKCYQISRIRKGNRIDSYTDPVYWSNNPMNSSFTRPILILINRYSMSAAEAFSLALKGQPHIKFMGEPSAGAFSDAEDAYLPNGWHFTYSVGVWTDCNGVLWEEKGIQPDFFIKQSNEANSNNDLLLEQALKELKKLTPSD
ncbi:MAG: S41 family peptidase [Bacteroidota bacterium]|nr:S41 family peptidase [Bacteroidota bacterium]